MLRTRTRRSVRLDPAALRAVIVRELMTFRPFWRTTTLDSTVQPLVYLLAFGFGLRSFIPPIAGHTYLDFLGTGLVASAVLSASMFHAAYATYLKLTQHTYDAILASPTDPDEVVTGEALWIAARAGVYACAPLLLAIPFGLRPHIAAVIVPLIAALAAFGWACFGVIVGARARRVESFAYIDSGLVMPVILLGGVFFPLSGLPRAVQGLAWLDPVYHCAELVRSAAFGFAGWLDLAHLTVLVAFALAAWRLAIAALARKLVL